MLTCITSRSRVSWLYPLAAVAAVGLLGSLPTVGAAFSGTAANPPNTFAAGTVALDANTPTPAVALLTMNDGRPGDAPVTGCIRVTYTGTVPARVRLFAASGGTGLATYLNLTVERGTTTGTTLPDCTGFTPDSATYAAASGVMYSGTLAGLASAHGSHASGLQDPTSGSPTTWTAGTTVTYRFTASIQNDPAAQGLTATPTFWWEARDG
ncbi:hypothetical protein [Spirilliplanes yamanashiensis]|uniref:Uncharacterized protein n=1 Tax=Spirilliplanes yamanashiensis TaxID=42233 RepID=A0A8J3YBQ3_9ACTN|nr:hypothetical protein [Spirilliplanes yamanashiensis]MDP9816279.1 hypothetical protein [Spirilliplanes yamanashiensis]GIJ05806.1 hypothetical protein Sya03_51580 [Spirilliplanes yamanashiensis]